MKILGISGSPNKNGNNEKIINLCLETAKNRGFETEQIYISSLNVKPCKACGVCKNGEPCPIDDDMDQVYQKLKDADGIIVSSPVYFGSVTAQIKALFDRSVLLRRQGFQLKNKPGGALTIGGSKNGGQEKTLQTIHDWMHIHGMIVVGDNNHFGGTLQKPIDSDETGMKTANGTIEKICDILDLIK